MAVAERQRKTTLAGPHLDDLEISSVSAARVALRLRARRARSPSRSSSRRCSCSPSKAHAAALSPRRCRGELDQKKCACLFASATVTVTVPEPLQLGFATSCGVAIDIADALGAVLPKHHEGADAHQAVSHVVKLWAQQLLDPTGEIRPTVAIVPGQMPLGGIEFELALAEGVATLVIDAVAH